MKINKPHFVILAAGKGTRLGGFVPKPLTQLDDGRTIIQQQLDNIAAVFGVEALKRVRVVVGHRFEEVVEAIPREVTPVYNPAFDMSNTAHSLTLGLRSVWGSNGVVWLNGDVVFSPFVLSKAVALIEADQSFMAVTEGVTSDEEMKYTLEDDFISKVSKENTNGVGEAVGINYVSSKDKTLLTKYLSHQANQAYFEAGIVESIRLDMKWKALPINEFYAVEVDFIEDLQKANSVLLEASKVV